MSIDPRQALRTKIERLPGGFAEAADRLGCTSAWLYILCSRRRRKPKGISMDFAGRVRDEFGIPVESWVASAKHAA